MDYYNLYTLSIWHVNPDGTGFEKIDRLGTARLGGYPWIQRLAGFPALDTPTSKSKEAE